MCSTWCFGGTALGEVVMYSVLQEVTAVEECDVQGVAGGYCAMRGCVLQSVAWVTAVEEAVMYRVLQVLVRYERT